MANWTIDRPTLEDIANGACIYGSGGGGASSLIPGLIEAILDGEGSQTIDVIDVSEINHEERVAMPAAAGSPDSATGPDFARNLANAALEAFQELSNKVGGTIRLSC